jgi:hypothetical protein
MKLVGPLAARCQGFGLLLPLRLSATASADEILQGRKRRFALLRNETAPDE